MAELSELLDRVQASFTERIGGSPDVLAWGPGRVNLIGEHTDYTGGLAMPAAIDRWVVVALRGRGDGRVVAHSVDFDDCMECAAGQVPQDGTSWRRFAGGATAVLSGLRPSDQLGWEGVILGDVPLGAGLSSSAAVEVALLSGLRALWELPLSRVDIARLGQRVEHEHLGLHSGLLDQMASVLSQPDQLLLLDFRDLSFSHVPADLSRWAWVVVDSGVRRELASSAYEQRVRECAQGLEALGLAHYRDIRQLSEGPVWARRLRHYVEENQRVREVAAALERGAVEEVGRLLVASHASLRDLYQVSCPELDTLVELASDWGGWAGGRMVGGGFGGCTLNLVRRSRLEGFSQALEARYHEATGRRARSWTVRLVGAGGARRR